MQPIAASRPVQVVIMIIGVLGAAAMIMMGLWQMQVYERQGDDALAARAAEPAVPLAQVAAPARPVTDGYGRTVTFTGTFRPSTQLLVPIKGTDRFRVLIAVQQNDGSAVWVVRGEHAGTHPPPPPAGPQQLRGVLAATETSVPAPAGGWPEGQFGSVELGALAQREPWPLVAGYVTLSPELATAQGLLPAKPGLPHADGRLRNGMYALQWWLFAAFALGMAIKMTRDVEHRLHDDDAPTPSVLPASIPADPSLDQEPANSR